MLRALLNTADRVLRRLRSPKWRKLEKDTIARHPWCEACGGSRKLQVHHREPVHLRKDLELDPLNLHVLCMYKYQCHFRVGHGSDWKAWNPNLEADIATLQRFPSRRAAIEETAKKARRYAVV